MGTAGQGAWSGSELREGFAAALAIGRFGDEDSGVVVGIPDEDWLDIKSGAATVWEGNRYMLELAKNAPAWEKTNPHLPAIPILSRDQFLVPQEFADEFPLVEVGDRFGAALAAVDFDGDGIDEIAVGAPRAGFSGRPPLSRPLATPQPLRPAWTCHAPDAAGRFGARHGRDNDATRFHVAARRSCASRCAASARAS